jgi:endonuclease/exonuclease/phosphatase family metal-dependent hydrolase
MAAAGLLRQVTDSIFRLSDDANIIIMGDFNDDPQDESLLKGLNALFPEELPQPRKIYNLTGAPASGPVMGTLKYQGTWNSFDQIMVSGNMLSGKGLCADKNAFVILQHSFLLEPDEVYHGQRPFRTYTGFRYRGGFSDHLPVYVEMKKIK